MLQHIIPRDYQGRRPATGRSEIPHRGDAGGIGGKRNQSFEERRQLHTKKKTSYHEIIKAGGPRLEGARYPTGVMPEASGVRGISLSKKDVSSTKKRHHK